MTITPKFEPTDIIWYISPWTGAIQSKPVLEIFITIDIFSNVIILNKVEDVINSGGFYFNINDDLAFATQADLVAAYSAQEALPLVGDLEFTGIAPTISSIPSTIIDTQVGALILTGVDANVSIT
jgi:hypothetical protein